MAGLRIALLGGLEITGGKIAALASLIRKTRALVAYLVLRGGRGQSREKLAELLWSNSAEEQARANLRQTLSLLRKALNGDGAASLVADGDRISLAGPDIELDVALFEQLVAEATPDALKRAAALYKGNFLDGFSLKEDSFESWARTERERLRHLASDALTRLIAHCDEVGDRERCVETATRLLILDPLRETAHRILMRAYAAQGRPASALKQFEACRDILKRELGVEPEPETVALYRELRQLRRAAPEGETDTAPKPVAEGPPPPDKPSIAVLPFTNMSGDPEQEYFADGITEDIISALSHFKELSVVSRNSSFVFKGRAASLGDVREKLKVDYLVEGSIRKAGNRVRITAQLIDAKNDNHIWADRYDRDLADIFEVQDDVVRRVASTLVGRLEHERQERTKRQTNSQLKAYDLYLRAREHFFNWYLEDNRQARDLLESAIQIEPDYAAALALHSEVLLRMWLNGWSDRPEEDLAESFAAAKRADEIDDQDSRTQTALGVAYLFQRRLEKAKHHFESALKLNPNDTRVLVYYSRQAVFDGDTKQAVELCHQAVTLNPYGKYSWNLGVACFVARRYGETIELFETMRNPPETVLAILAASFAMSDDDAKAAATYVRFMPIRLTQTPTICSMSLRATKGVVVGTLR
jgi:TolB-like protein/DNA-binding SARP family transcriptional activator/Tfp pilus assembly protein PilF